MQRAGFFTFVSGNSLSYIIKTDYEKRQAYHLKSVIFILGQILQPHFQRNVW